MVRPAVGGSVIDIDAATLSAALGPAGAVAVGVVIYLLRRGIDIRVTVRHERGES